MKATLTTKLAKLGQEHLLTFWDELDSQQQQSLAAQIESVDFALLDRLYHSGGSHVDWDELAKRAVAPPAFRLQGENRLSPEQARKRGKEALSSGKIGVILVAGGQGTRLGFEHPKGMYSVGPVSGASLFQIHLEKVIATGRRYGVAVPLYLMTSPATHDETITYLNEHDRFGLAEQDLQIFCQGTMPAMDASSGKLLLADRGRLFLSPDGHGGTLAALASSGALADMQQRGIEQLYYFQVDNPLTPVCDPEFLGYHLLSESELSTLAIAKQLPQERVGNIASIDGQVQIIEYSDLPDEAAERRNPDGSLELWAGNTAIHAFDVAFLRRMAAADDSLPFHVANKAVPHLNEAGEHVSPEKPNALKFEKFIFDLLPAARNAIVVEADVAKAFAPLKNASGAETDTPETVHAAMIALHRGWLEAAGAKVVDGVKVEISPLYALDAEQTTENIKSGGLIEEDRYFAP